MDAFLLDLTAKQQMAGFSPEDLGRCSNSTIDSEIASEMVGSMAMSRAVRPRELSLKGSAPESRRRRTSWIHG